MLDRRELLRLSAAAAAASALPAFLAEAFGPFGLPGARAGIVKAGLGRAQLVGKPLLVLVIPEAVRERHARGEVLGGLLNHGGDEALADLALAEVVCAMRADLVRALGDGVPQGEPIAWVVEQPAAAPTFVVVDPELADEPEGFAERWEDLDARAEQRIETLAKALRGALCPDAAASLRRSEAAAHALPAAQVESLRRALAEGGDLPTELAWKGAAIVRAVAEHEAARRRGLLATLARAARAELVAAPPAGARWAVSTGCGTRVEGDEQEGPMVACGMAMIPRVSRRFLWFFTREE